MRPFYSAAALAAVFALGIAPDANAEPSGKLTVSVIGRYRYRPLHLFGGLGLLLGALGFGVLLYLTVLKIDGHAIGQRPLLFLGVLLMVVGLQFFSLGLISELITSQHEERAGARERTELHVDEVLS